ncbi:cyclic di-GMP phosphodiesterase Gmr [Clostridium puniceum]|uniref:Cyclic di-GMP phosphodiesterase Gmr n=1 Tax=Clostridium puniceum TaxID=29367 RepID=A0A1S8TKJ7_9CLOT|nr:EAL domain-containing protein [Clostridium puniceum]OOM78154.1 cyclic di-GMP phosphodiesterase Gmr [Clostridium puniceum]
MRFTFRLKIFIYFVAIILVTSIPISLITYNYIYNSLKNHVYLNAKSQMLLIDDNFHNIINQLKEDTEFLGNSYEIKKADQSISALFNIPNIELNPKYSKQSLGIEGTIYNELENYGTTHPRTTYVYVGTKWGGYVQWPDGLSASKFDPRERPWYNPALEKSNEVIISNPYISAIDNSNNVIISASTAIKDVSENIVGVMGIDISLKNLSDMIKNTKVSDSGYIFLFLKDGTILAHPDTNLNFKNISELKIENGTKETERYSKNFFQNYNKFTDGDKGNFETIINGEEVLVSVCTSPYTGWKMASVIQKSELTNNVDEIGYLISVITLFSLLFAIGFSFIVTKRITKPIAELTPLMNAAGKGDLSVKANINTNDELGELGESFNLMIGQLSSNYDELSAVYEELLATEEAVRAQYDELASNEEALKNSEERYKLALECVNDSIWELDLVTGKFFASDKLYDITGYKLYKDIDILRFLGEKIHPEDVERSFKEFQDHINNLIDVYKSEFRFKKNNGDYVWLFARGMALRNSENKAIKLAGSVTDISYRKFSEEKIKFMAYYDSLTKLKNRTSFINNLNEQLEFVKSENLEGAVFFIDLDNFKNINDTMGHDYGDKLLIYLAQKFENWINEEDIICRLGGDEFILLHPNANESEAKFYAKKFLKLFNKPCKIDGKQIYITVSIGIALYPKDGIDSNTILKNADAAMYKAKELGKNRFVLFDQDMYLKLERKTRVERILRTAIENNELSINYQPQYDVQNNEIFGFESLLRLNSKELGFISPLEFISIAEECGYITQLGQWVIEESCKQSVKWLKQGYKFKSISVNISSVDLQQANFLENVKKIINKTSIDPRILELEITETVLMESLDSSISILKKLMDMGIRIALDDFGTGYSSLSYLRKIPINTLKIDKSFIDNITSNQKEESIINNIIQMAHSLELKVVAEGVETKDQLSVLKERDCDYIQGYYFSKPLPPGEIEKLLSKKE